MVNSRAKGKRGERNFINALRDHHPGIKPNREEQAADGGLDFVNTGEFAYEVKCGKQCKIIKIKKWLDQLNTECPPTKSIQVLLIKPDREDAYVIMPYSSYDKLLLRASNLTYTLKPANGTHINSND
jgi:hypothetical protein